MTESLRLDVPHTIGEVARYAGWPKQRMRRWLLIQHAKHPDLRILERKTVVRNVHAKSGEMCETGPWMVPSVLNLQKIWPEFGKKTFTAEDVEKLRDQVKNLDRQCVSLRARLRKSEEVQRKLEQVIEFLATNVAALAEKSLG